MSETTVIHVRDMQPGDVYIGRAVPRRRLLASPWANPFPLLLRGNRSAVLTEFDGWVRTSDDPRAAWIRAHIEEFRGKRLACWCHPKPCHGDVLVKILAEREATK